jgi:alpha-mannosidase
VENWQARTAEFLSPGQYKFDGPRRKIATPLLTASGKTIFLRVPLTVGADVDLKRAFLEFQFDDIEALLSIDGVPYCGLDWGHKRIQLPRRGRMELVVEAMSMPPHYWDPGVRGRTSRFLGARVCTVSPELEGLAMDVTLAWETANATKDLKRKALLEQTVEAVLLAVDMQAPRADLLRQVKAARVEFARRLGDIPLDAGAGSIFAVGHSHIDVAWLWPLRETVRKTARTFATACRLMERYPNFHFACSQPQLYQYAKEHYPELYSQVKKWVRSGRWETTGAMWVEADCNVPSGESLIRQILEGLEFFRREFGTRPRGCWLPDVFGYPASLPEILAGCGLDHFFTCKLHWQSRNGWPNHLFRWRGLDGTEILSHIPQFPGMYNNEPFPDQLISGWERYGQKAQHGQLLFTYGHGDGGGGANEGMLERLTRQEKGFPGLPAIQTGPSEQYFLQAAEADLPLWDGELYLETHRGTFTTQGHIKRANRQAEWALREADFAASLARAAGAKVDTDSLQQAWRLLLLNQFHDILPGSSIGMVYEEALTDHQRIQDLARSVKERALAVATPKQIVGSTDRVCVLNTLSWKRDDVVEVELKTAIAPRSLVAPDGASTPVQVLDKSGGKARVLLAPPEAPSCGYGVYQLSSEPCPEASSLEVSATTLQNRYWRIRLNRDGGIVELFDKINRRSVLEAGQVGNDLQLFQDGPECEDAWNLHATVGKKRYPIQGPTTLRVVEKGPLRGCLRVERHHGKTTIRQDIVLYVRQPRIDFVTHVDWKERHTVLKAAFPLALRSTRATYEVQFGAVERPTHRNTPWDQEKFEVPAQRWADISEAGYGVSLLNDCKYGYDALNNVLRLTLLRGTSYPDPIADLGEHDFTYSLLPHAGNWSDSGTVARAWELTTPLGAWPVAADTPLTRRSLVRVEGAAAVVQTLKVAQDGRGLVLRLYEPHGGRGQVRVQLDLPVRAVHSCNLVEEDGPALKLRDGAFEFDINPFQIRTFRLHC